MQYYFFNSMIMILMMIILVMISVAFFTLFERKIMAEFHYRKGPNKVSFYGMLQPFSDALKLINKEFFYPLKSNLFFFILSPMLMLILSLSMWLIYPFYTNLINFKFNILFFLVILSMNVYGLLISGWSSNTNFSMIGAIRSMAQSISYEVIFSIIILLMLNLLNTFNLFMFNFFNKYNFMMFLTLTPLIILLISMLAEINRTPFDLSESESELISGFNIEYGSGKFMLIFLAEYSNILFMMFFLSFLFLSSKLYFNILLFLYLNIIMMIYLITWIRMTLPRIRYDKLMFLCWFWLLPYILLLYLVYMYMYKYLMDLILLI